MVTQGSLLGSFLFRIMIAASFHYRIVSFQKTRHFVLILVKYVRAKNEEVGKYSIFLSLLFKTDAKKINSSILVL